MSIPNGVGFRSPKHVVQAWTCVRECVRGHSHSTVPDMPCFPSTFSLSLLHAKLVMPAACRGFHLLMTATGLGLVVALAILVMPVSDQAEEAGLWNDEDDPERGDPDADPEAALTASGRSARKHGGRGPASPYGSRPRSPQAPLLQQALRSAAASVSGSSRRNYQSMEEHRRPTIGNSKPSPTERSPSSTTSAALAARLPPNGGVGGGVGQPPSAPKW